MSITGTGQGSTPIWPNPSSNVGGPQRLQPAQQDPAQAVPAPVEKPAAPDNSPKTPDYTYDVNGQNSVEHEFEHPHVSFEGKAVNANSEIQAVEKVDQTHEVHEKSEDLAECLDFCSAAAQLEATGPSEAVQEQLQNSGISPKALLDALNLAASSALQRFAAGN